MGHAVLSRSGNLVEFAGTVIDLTERKRAEQELLQLVDFVPQIIAVLSPDGLLINVNRVGRKCTDLAFDPERSVDLRRYSLATSVIRHGHRPPDTIRL